MRVSTSTVDGTLNLEFRLDDRETLDGVGQIVSTGKGMPIRLVTNVASIRHPALSAKMHPDLVALAILTTVVPWARDRLWLDEPVSRTFASAVDAGFGIEIGPVDDGLLPRTRGDRVGLMYSGGTDSVALLEFLPTDSALIHLRRVRHPRVPNRATHLRVDVSEHYARKAETPQRELHVVETDVEFLCQPFPTYPTWLTLGIGAVLLADTLDLGAVALGLVLGGRYLSQGRVFNPDGDNDRGWSDVFEAAGLPLFRGMLGASEILTYGLVERSGQAQIARSCQLGTIAGPCRNCGKCLRKELIGAALGDQPLPSGLLESISANQSVTAALLRPPPYYNQHILEYVLARVPGLEGTFLEKTKDQLDPTVAGTEWLTRYYQPALEQIPDGWRESFQSRLLRSVDLMTDADRSIMEHWDAAER